MVISLTLHILQIFETLQFKTQWNILAGTINTKNILLVQIHVGIKALRVVICKMIHYNDNVNFQHFCLFQELSSRYRFC